MCICIYIYSRTRWYAAMVQDLQVVLNQKKFGEPLASYVKVYSHSVRSCHSLLRKFNCFGCANSNCILFFFSS